MSARLPIVLLLYVALIASSLGQGLLRLVEGGAPEKKDEKTSSMKWETPRLMMPIEFSENSLQWINGESLSGKLEGFSHGKLVWKTDLFEEPLRLDPKVLDRVDFEAKPDIESEGSFRLTLIDGTHVMGNIDTVADGILTLNSARAGLISAKLDSIVSLERSKVSDIDGGPLALRSGQKQIPNRSRRNNDTPNMWMYAAAGRIATPSFNQTLMFSNEVPDKGVIEIKFRTDSVPHFSIRSGSIKLETWSDELVLTDASRFASARAFYPDESRGDHFRVCWDREIGYAAVYDAAGKVLLELKSEAKDRGGESVKGVLVHNKGSGMIIERFQASSWSGKPLPTLPEEEAYVVTVLGVIQGELTGRKGNDLIISKPDGTTEKVAVAFAQALRWPRQPNLEVIPESTDLWYADGQLIRGKLIDGETLRLENSAIVEPIAPKIENLRAMVLAKPATSEEEGKTLEELDGLVYKDKTLHGHLEFDGGPLPRFYPFGSEEAVALAPSEKWSLTRSIPDEGVTQEIAPGLLHVGERETFPIKLTAIHRDHIEFQWDAVEKQSLPTTAVHAIQLGTPGTRDSSFVGPDWRVMGKSKRQLKRSGDSVTLTPGAGIQNTYALQGQQVSFRMAQTNGNASIRVRLFADEDHKKDGISYLIAHYGGIYCGIERGVDSGQMTNNQEVPTNESSVVIRFSISEKEVQLFVDDVPCAKAKLTDKNRAAGIGVMIETASLWNNEMGNVLLSEFTNQGSSMTAGRASYKSEAKREALLLPRLRRDDPPRHVLIGRNGDLLRGTIEALTSDHLAFRTGLETFKVPQERVASMVWVRPQEEAPSDTPSSKEGPRLQWMDLRNGGRIGLEVESLGEDVTIGNHPLLGKCRIPSSLIYQLRFEKPLPSSAHAALADWRFENTPDPILPEDEGVSSPLVGYPAKDFTLSLVDEGSFTLSEAKGKVVVLDFWATWCGPCVKSLPSLIDTMATFPQERVVFMTIDQGESKQQVAQFLKARKLSMPVAMDGDQKVGRDYGAESIPHTVVIDHEGTVSFVKSGFSADGAEQISEAVKEALEYIPTD